MKTIIKYINRSLLLLAIFISPKLYGQQETMNSQYMFNIQSFNPAYAGSWESLGILASTRQQWVGFDGHPQTSAITLQSLLSEKVGFGLSISDDKISNANYFSLFADYSYKVDLSKTMALRLGLKAGLTYFTNSNWMYSLLEPFDPSIGLDDEYKFIPNVGFGAFLYSDKFYAGLSIPKLIRDPLVNEDFGLRLNQFFLTSGYVFDIHNYFKIKPSVIIRYINGSSIIADLNATVILFDKIWLGAMVRTTDFNGFGLNANFIISDIVRIGYSYDFMDISGKNFDIFDSNYYDYNDISVNAFNNGTHEIFISIEIKQSKSKFTSPRYF